MIPDNESLARIRIKGINLAMDYHKANPAGIGLSTLDQRRFTRAIAQLLSETLSIFVSSVVGFFALLLLAAGAVLTWLVGCASAIFLLIALAETAWWLHTHSHHAAVTALGFYGYSAATFAVIPVFFLLRDKLGGWSEPRR
jgi:hypothetical protein